jgi:hypothetical protein
MPIKREQNMASDFDNALRTAAGKIAAYVEDAATMTVITQYVTIAANGDADFTTARPVARTILRLDGDSEAIVPVRETEAGSGRFEPDATLLDLHERNVAAATEYRSRVLQSLIAALPQRLR